MTLDEMAKALGVSKSTVSRALSGKGRIGEETREKIIAFAREKGYTPDLPEGKQEQEKEHTGNIAVALPADAYITGSPYFHECLLGICETARFLHYDVMITIVTEKDYSGIENLIRNRKADGIILTRSMENNQLLKYLEEYHFPTAVTGTTNMKDVIQVDTDNEGAAETLTDLLISTGYRKFAGIFDNLQYTVDRQRCSGFRRALYRNGIPVELQSVYTGITYQQGMDSLIGELLAHRVECLICGDDIICTRMMSALQAAGYRIPMDIAVASMYNSVGLNCFTPSVTTVNVMARRMGNVACAQLIRSLTGQEFQVHSLVDYEILVRKSTKRIAMERER